MSERKGGRKRKERGVKDGEKERKGDKWSNRRGTKREREERRQ